MWRLFLTGVLATASIAASPFPPTIRLIGARPETLDLSAWSQPGPWIVEGCPEGIDACVEGDSLVLNAAGEGGTLGLVQLRALGRSMVIPVERRPMADVELVYSCQEPAPSSAFVAGSFNGWSATANPMECVDGSFHSRLALSPGTYHYKFVVDGSWIADPTNPDRVDDGLGGHNSVIHIGLGTSTRRFLKTGHQDGTLTFSLYPPDDSPEAVFVLLDGLEAPFSYEEGLLRVTPQGGGLLRILGLDAQSRPLPECWTWLDHGQPRGRPGADAGFYDSLIYSLFPDRFRNGDPSNDRPLCHPGVHHLVNYQGGDLAGVRHTLDEGYFDSLGVSTLWMGPLYPGPEKAAISPLEYTNEMRGLSVEALDSLLTESVDPYFGARRLPIPDAEFPAAMAYSGYHGYWPAADRAIESRFGAVALMRDLVAAAHARGLRVILDLVPHHVHVDHPWATEHPSLFQNLTLPDGTLNLRHWDEHRLSTWFDPFLPTLDLSLGAPGVDSMVCSAAWWLTTFDLDGFRHDATKHIPHGFWRALTAGLREASPHQPLLQIGETFGSRALVGSYVCPAEMDGQFDFNLYYASRPLFCGRPGASFVQVIRELDQSLDSFGPLHMMANVTGSHDQVRFVTLAQGDMPPGADERRWGWTNEVTVRDPIVYRRMQLFFLFNLSIPGIPVLYYGDEIGMPGAADPDNRRMMRFGDELSTDEHMHLASMRALGRLKRDIPALSFGDFLPLHIEDHVLVMARAFFDDYAVIAFNLTEHEWSGQVSLQSLAVKRLLRRWGEGEANQYAGAVRLEVPPLSALVLSTR
ncbi:hypothetical protein JXA88_11960 [Candidatus Fermentibacteria bacterium]|nr:hypothetical protein [Candidatus Fermentibacteria bacterium]